MKKTRDEIERTTVYEFSYGEVEALLKIALRGAGAIKDDERIIIEPITSWVQDNHSFDLIGFKATIKRRSSG